MQHIFVFSRLFQHTLSFRKSERQNRAKSQSLELFAPNRLRHRKMSQVDKIEHPKKDLLNFGLGCFRFVIVTSDIHFEIFKMCFTIYEITFITKHNTKYLFNSLFSVYSYAYFWAYFEQFLSIIKVFEHILAVLIHQSSAFPFDLLSWHWFWHFGKFNLFSFRAAFSELTNSTIWTLFSFCDRGHTVRTFKQLGWFLPHSNLSRGWPHESGAKEVPLLSMCI